jgi:hypothetical protein
MSIKFGPARRSTSMACVLAALGCFGGDKQAADTPAPSGDSQPPATVARTPNMPASWETITPAAFKTYVETTLTFDTASGERDVERHCRPPDLAACQGTGRRPRVDIAPAQNTGGIDPNNLHANGHVVARLHNKSTLRRENRYNLPPDVQVYWLITSGRSRFVWFDAAGRRNVVGDMPYFTGCENKDAHAKRAGFKRCPIQDAAPLDSVALAAAKLSDPAWVSCVPGCCVAAEAI